MRRAPLVLVATSVAAFTATLDNTVVAVALRDMQQDLEASVPGLQGVVTAYTVSLAALLLVGGALVDLLGAKRVLLIGVAVFAAASAGCALAPTTPLLVAARAVQGTGAALLLPGGLAVLAAAYPDEHERRRAVGTWAAVGGLALVAGPVVGGVLVEHYGWAAVFWVNVPLCALVAAVVATTPVVPTHSRRLDVPGSVLSCAGLGLATYAVVLAGRDGLTAGVGLALLGAAAAVLALRAAERRPDPLLPSALLRDRRFDGAALAAFAASLAVFVLMVFVALFLELVQKVSAQHAGLLLLPLPLGLVLVAPLAGRLRAVAAPVAVGLVLSGAGLLALGRVLDRDLGHPLLEVLLAVVGVGVGLTTAPVVTAALSAAGEARAGLAAASVNVARELGGVVAVAGLGALAVARLSHRLTDVLTAAGVSPSRHQELLDLLLRADSAQVRKVLLDDIGIDGTLKLGSGLSRTATDSFVGSTQVVLQVAGVALIGIAVLSARLLRQR